jgi:hypothetical protein
MASNLRQNTTNKIRQHRKIRFQQIRLLTDIFSNFKKPIVNYVKVRFTVVCIPSYYVYLKLIKFSLLLFIIETIRSNF